MAADGSGAEGDRKKDGMEKFEIELQGKNFLFDRDGEPGKFGFNARCFVRARSPEEAGKMAAILVRQNPLLKDALVDSGMAAPAIRLVQARKAGALRFLLKRSATKIDFFPEEEV